MRNTFAIVGAACALVSLTTCGAATDAISSATAPSEPASAVRLSFLRAPSPLPMNGRVVLAWELLLENTGERPVDVAAVVVGDTRHEGASLAARMKCLSDVDAESLPDLREMVQHTRAEDPTLVPPGRGAVFFGWMERPDTTSVPSELPHRVELEGGAQLEVRLDVGVAPPRVLGPPLAGPGWISFGSPADEGGHRRTVLRLGGAYYVPQRFAIDWGGMDAEGRLVRGGGSAEVPADYAAYGAPVLAVADGTVEQVHDGVPEQAGGEVGGERAVAVTLDTVAGNSVVIDVGEGHHAVYAHLVPGSITVAPGETVRAGQVIGRLGSSGNATGPHLHFHLCDRASVLVCEGVPYVFESFDSVECSTEGESLEAARFTRLGETSRVERELVRDERIIDFPALADSASGG